MLEVSELAAGYGRIPILGGVSFSVARGEFVGILGHNGMGKTTLLRALMGYLPATAGRVVLEDTDITRAEPYRRARAGMGYVPQGRDIFPGLSVRDNLRMGAVGRPKDEDAAIGSALKTFPRLEPLIDRPGGALSGGEQQLLAIARCLAGNPRLILLDEPTEGIQPSIIDEIGDASRPSVQGRPDDDPCRAESRLHRHSVRASPHHPERRHRAFRRAGRTARAWPRQ